MPLLKRLLAPPAAGRHPEDHPSQDEPGTVPSEASGQAQPAPAVPASTAAPDPAGAAKAEPEGADQGAAAKVPPGRPAGADPPVAAAPPGNADGERRPAAKARKARARTKKGGPQGTTAEEREADEAAPTKVVAERPKVGEAAPVEPAAEDRQAQPDRPVKAAVTVGGQAPLPASSAPLVVAPVEAEARRSVVGRHERLLSPMSKLLLSRALVGLGIAAVVAVAGWLRGDLAAGLEIGAQFGIFSFAVATWSALAERRRVARIVEASGRTLPGLTDSPWNGQGAAEEDEPDAAAETELPAAVNEPDVSTEEPDQGEADQARERLVSRSGPQRS